MFLRRKDKKQVEDADLVAAIRRGDRNALGGLWDRYAHLLFGVGMKYMKDPDQAKDLVVELFASLPELLRKHEIDRLRPWIHTVMRNRCLMALRSKKPLDPINEKQFAMDDRSAENAMLHEMTLQRLEKAVQQLDTLQRTCITLFYLERNSYREVAAITGLSIDAVRSNIQNGRRNLRIALERHAERA